MVCRNILFLIFTRDVFLVSFLLISGNAVFFYRFEENVLEGVKDRNTSIFLKEP